MTTKQRVKVALRKTWPLLLGATVGLIFSAAVLLPATPGAQAFHHDGSPTPPPPTCTPTPPPHDGDEGCTPGFWKNHLDDWAPSGLSPGDDFDLTFGVDLFDPNITLEQAVNAKGGGVKKLARHGTAALISAAHPGVDYPLTVADVIAAVQAGDDDTLAAANELGCPLN